MVQEYRYLGLHLTEHLDLNHTVKCVAQAASRSLGLVIAKFKAYGGLHHSCFTKLYDTLVDSVISYGSAIWGYKSYSAVNAVQNRACRFYLGVGKYTPNCAVQGDMGWRFPEQRQWLQVSRLWCRMSNMNRDRINYKVFAWSRRLAIGNVKNWSFHVSKFYRDIAVEHIMCTDNVLDTPSVIRQLDSILQALYIEKWEAVLNRQEGRNAGLNKLRTYRTFKTEYGMEKYVTAHMTRAERSAMAKFRCGTAPIRIETGRYEGRTVENRICSFGCMEIENEAHVLIDCPVYDDLRTRAMQAARAHSESFDTLTSADKLISIMVMPETTITGKLCNNILIRRRSLLYD